MAFFDSIIDPGDVEGQGDPYLNDYEVDEALIKRQNLTRISADDRGNHRWEGTGGSIYYARDLAKTNYGSSDNQEYDAGQSDDNDSGYNNRSNDYTSDSVTDTTPTTNKTELLSSGGPAWMPENQGYSAPKRKPTSSNVPAPKRARRVWNPNSVLSSAGEVTSIYARASLSTGKRRKVDCSRKSYFFIKDRNGNKPDDAAFEFFEYLNDRAGGIFELCPDDGKVLLIKGKNPESVPVSKTTSRILALTINNGIEGGVGYNHAIAEHPVWVRVLDPETIELNNKYFFDDFATGINDLMDYKNLLVGPDDSEKEIIQAAFFGHFICERFAAPEYEKMKHVLPIEDYHEKGTLREIEILKEMTGIGAEIDSRGVVGEIKNNGNPYTKYIYPNRTTQVRIFIYLFYEKNTNAGRPDYTQVIRGASIEYYK